MKRILVGTDFSNAAQRAVRTAASWAHRERAQLRIVHVVPPRRWLVGPWRSDPALAGAAHRQARAALRKLADDLDPRRELELSTGLVVGAASVALRRAVRDFQPDLLVIGARGEHESGARELSLGGTALKLLATSPTPLLLVRRDSAEPPTSVLAAVDLGPLSGEVLAWAARCVAADGRLDAFHAWEAPFAARLESYGLSRASIDLYADEEQQRREQTLVSLIGAACGERPVRRIVVRGDAIERLFEQLSALEPELVALGRHEARQRRGSQGGFGSVCRHTALFAPTDVLVVPPRSAAPGR